MPGIIAGELGGRLFEMPRGHRTHPMSTKVRGALFNALGDMRGLTVLDPFAGSGALSFEAISYGAAQALLIEIDKNAAATIERNIEALGVSEKAKLIRANCSSWSDRNLKQQFDILLVDPPYDNLQKHVLEKLVRHVKPGGLYVLAWPGRQEPPALPGLEMVKFKDYGDATLAFYRKSDR